MGCRQWVLGLALAALGVGILVGGLMPSWLVVCLLGALLIALGFILMR